MNAVEIEAAISDLAQAPFDAGEFPYAFLAAFGHKDTALKRLRTGNNNASDVAGGVLLRNNIHIAICSDGGVDQALKNLRESPSTVKAKAKFILATDGKTLEAEELINGETITCAFEDFPNHFGFLLPLGGISTIKEIKDNPVDIRATGRLNKLYVELLRENQDWATADRRADMNHFMARLIFCFFAEDTDIFNGQGLFTKTVEQMSERDGSNVHEVLGEIFRAMNVNTRHDGQFDNRHRLAAKLRPWADQFPYVNGGLFSGSTDVPRFTRMARIYLIHAGSLNWRQINPDIFGSMIQAVADDEERGALGMHYTSVPNILKVLNPLFLDDLREQLETAGDNKAKLLNLRKRIARIRVFDPACGSGNFLVIAYKQMREIEAEINRRRDESHLGSEIPVNNFRGIELRDFPAEIARLALIIAEYQCDVLYRGQKDAVAEFLPLDSQNWIICGNALRLDWLSICPPTGTGVKVVSDDLFNTPFDQTEIDFENEGGETYICGNPPYKGSQGQNDEQKDDLAKLFSNRYSNWKSLDYVSGWFLKATDYGLHTHCSVAFVTTNSICQGRQVETLWAPIFSKGFAISFAHTSFKWTNLASHNAGVTVAIVGISNNPPKIRKLFSESNIEGVVVKNTNNINPYLISGPNIFVIPYAMPICMIGEMSFGNMPNDGGHLLLSYENACSAIKNHGVNHLFIKSFYGSQEFIRGHERRCIWITKTSIIEANKNSWLSQKFSSVEALRAASNRKSTKELSKFSYRFGEVRQTGTEVITIIPRVSSENREFLPVGLLPAGSIISDAAFALFDAPIWSVALIASRMHIVWIATVCGRMKTDFRYSNTLGWNTFPVPTLTEQNKADLTRCAEDILLAREAHFPASIADLYEVKDGASKMPDNLRLAHERNDEVLERIYIGRRFKNDTERLEKLFELYTKMTATSSKPPSKKIKKDKV